MGSCFEPAEWGSSAALQMYAWCSERLIYYGESNVLSGVRGGRGKIMLLLNQIILLFILN